MTLLNGSTIELKVENMDAGIAFYGALFGRQPDYMPHDKIAEWLMSERTVLQIADRGTVDTSSGPVRMLVDDIQKEAERVSQVLKIDAPNIETRSDVPVLWCTFEDPWGNKLGFFQRKEGHKIFSKEMIPLGG